MKFRNIILGSLGCIVLVLVISLIFAFDNTSLSGNSTVFGFYLAAKIIFALAFIGVVLYGILGKPSRGTFYPLIVLGILFQAVAPIMRAYVNVSSFLLGACLLTLLIPLLVFILVTSGILMASKKSTAFEEKTSCKEIEVKEDLPDKF